jgi:hypothetical protein
MMTKDAINGELTIVTEMIVTARAALAHNELVDIGDIPGRLRELMGSITDLPPDDAIELRPALIELLTDFKRFAAEVQEKIADLEATGGSDGQMTTAGRSGA